MRTVALIASFNRDLILRDCITCLQPQVDDIVLVGSSEWVDGSQGCDVEKKVAKDMDLVYVDHTNKILGKKWQSGLNKCRELNPDAVLICGSDDLLRHDWVKEISQKEDDLVGVNFWYVYNPILDELILISYSNIRNDPVGAGRIFRKGILDAADWQIFPTEGGIGCDRYSYSIVLKHGGSVHHYANHSSLLCVKGDWVMMDSWEQLLAADSLEIFQCIDSKDDFLKKDFPLIDFDKYRRKHQES